RAVTASCGSFGLPFLILLETSQPLGLADRIRRRRRRQSAGKATTILDPGMLGHERDRYDQLVLDHLRRQQPAFVELDHLESLARRRTRPLRLRDPQVDSTG